MIYIISINTGQFISLGSRLFGFIKVVLNGWSSYFISLLKFFWSIGASIFGMGYWHLRGEVLTYMYSTSNEYSLGQMTVFFGILPKEKTCTQGDLSTQQRLQFFIEMPFGIKLIELCSIKFRELLQTQRVETLRFRGRGLKQVSYSWWNLWQEIAVMKYPALSSAVFEDFKD